MSKLKGLLVALLALVFLSPAAWATPQVSEGNVGDLLLFPFFYADASVQTKIRVVNTNCEWGVIAKVVLRSSACSEELRDFLIVLSPNDVWTGTIKVEGSKVVLVSTDDSVIVPATGKPASEDNPFVVSLKMPKNPEDTNQFGYIEVMAVAKVNWYWKDDTNHVTFKSLAKDNGFDNYHAFAYYLYSPSNAEKYNGLAYCDSINPATNNDKLFNGLILPVSYVGSYDVNCADGNGNYTAEKLNPLYGTAEVTIPGGYAAYTATAVQNFVLLGWTQSSTNVSSQACKDNYVWYDNYKVPAAVDTPLNLAGCVDDLDVALAKLQVFAPYYDPDDSDSCGSFVMLFFPTMQSKYAYNKDAGKYMCMPQEKYTSCLWQSIWSKVITGTTGINVLSFDNFEHPASCTLSPCALKLKELYFIDEIEDIFDPYAFSEGWMSLGMPKGDGQCTISSTKYNVTYVGLPTVALVGFYNADGVTFVEPGYNTNANISVISP